MKYYIPAALILCLLLDCSATDGKNDTIVAPSQNSQYALLPVSPDELSLPKWQELVRFPAGYPIKEAAAGNMGCATIEYVILPNNSVTSVRVVESTGKHFSKEAKRVIGNWKWSDLPSNIVEEPVKTQTRFEFCLEDGAGRCSYEKIFANTQCPGTDVIASVGRKIQ